jgi:CheY-like chemotaxis protein
MRTILVVEDDHDTRVALRDAFEAQGYCVFSATNGRDALRVLPSLAAPVLVLLDQNLPLMTGDEFLRAKITDNKIASIPVIVMSAVSDRTQGLGASAFFSKPLDVDTLIDKVNTFFSKSSGIPPDVPLAGSTAYLAEPPKNPSKSTLRFSVLEPPSRLGDLLLIPSLRGSLDFT